MNPALTTLIIIIAVLLICDSVKKVGAIATIVLGVVLLFIVSCACTMGGCTPAPRIITYTQAQMDVQLAVIKQQETRLQVLHEALSAEILTTNTLRDQTEVQQHTIKILQGLLDRDKYTGWGTSISSQLPPVLPTSMFVIVDANDLFTLIRKGQ